MSSREISIWIDEHWYEALSKQLRDETPEDYLGNVLDEMCKLLPQQEYERINTLISQEQQRSREAAEAGRCFAVFHVTEHGESVYFLTEERLDMLYAALKLRNYLRRPEGSPPSRFVERFSRSEYITPEQFDIYVHERLDNTGRVVGAFDIDLDNGIFSALNIMDGWQSFRIQDISTAAYFAMKKNHAAEEQRWKIFLDRLDGKQLTQDSEYVYISGSRTLCERDISFSGDIMQNDSLLEFYMDVSFDADEVFGTHVCTAENDDFLKLYVNYDMENRCVCDAMDVYLVRSDGSEQDYKYRLSAKEQAFILPKMEEHCLAQCGLGLEEYSKQYMTEQSEASQHMQM